MKPATSIVVMAFALVSCSSAELRAPGSANATAAHFADVVNAQNFYKGNLHTHSTASDGDASPAKVSSWFKQHGYNFLVITDHDKLTVEHKHDSQDFITLKGVEITGMAAGRLPVHVNAICNQNALRGIRAERSVFDTLQAQVNLSHRDGAVTLVNHPNFYWALSSKDLLATDGFELLEIASGHPEVHDAGDSSHPGEEELWDMYMTTRHRIFGAAVDDSHDYFKFGEKFRNPGRAWVAVWAPALSTEALCTALREGHFYSARGAKISALVVSPQSMDLAVDHWQPSTDHVDFIGAGGQLLARVTDMPARYVLRGGEGYVRAHVVQAPAKDGGRREAWTQAYFIKLD